MQEKSFISKLNLSAKIKNADSEDKTVWMLSFGHLSVDSYSAFINPIMPFIAAKLGIALTLATTLISISHLCSSIIQPLFGYAADILKKRFFIVWGLIIASIFLSFTGAAFNFWILGLCLALGSMGVAFYHPQATGFVKQFALKNPTKAMSIFLAGGTVGFSAGPLISSFTVEHFGLERMPVLAIYGVVVGLLLLKFVPKTSDSSSFLNFKAQVFNSDFLSSFFRAVRESFAVNDLKILFAISVAKCLTVSSFCVFLPFLWQKMGYSVSKIGLLIFLFVLAGAIATIASSIFERKIGASMVFYLSMLTILPLSVLFLLTYVSAPIISYVAVVLTGFFALLAIPINMVMAQNAVPQYRGLVSGFIGGLSWGIVGVLLPFTGFVAEHIGIPTLLVLVSLVPFVCSFFVKKLSVKS